jgi:hypothetical protein
VAAAFSGAVDRSRIARRIARVFDVRARNAA